MNYSDLIASASARLSNLVTVESASLMVPSCPEWNLLDLALHLGEVHEFWALNIRESDPEKPFDGERAQPAHSIDSLSWCREQTSLLLKTFEEFASDRPCWTWWGEPRTAGAVARHQVQEAVIHCWDAENTLGVAAPISLDIALDGIAEYLHVHREAFDYVGLPGLKFSVLSSDKSWTINPEKAIESTTSASASDLVLFLNGRKGLADVKVEGSLDGITRLISAMPEINS